MSNKVLSTLNNSIEQLEKAIQQTRNTISKLSNPKPEVVVRLDCYQEVLTKQKVLVRGLEHSLKEKNWQQVSRFVELIKGSSLLIQLDTQAMITEISSSPTTEYQAEH